LSALRIFVCGQRNESRGEYAISKGVLK